MCGSWQSCSACIQLHSTMRSCCCSRGWPPGGMLQHARGRRQQPGSAKLPHGAGCSTGCRSTTRQRASRPVPQLLRASSRTCFRKDPSWTHFLQQWLLRGRCSLNRALCRQPCRRSQAAVQIKSKSRIPSHYLPCLQQSWTLKYQASRRAMLAEANLQQAAASCSCVPMWIHNSR